MRSPAAALLALSLAVPVLGAAIGGSPASAAPADLGNQTSVRIDGPARTPATNSWFGGRVALSADGLTALVGDDNEYYDLGTLPSGEVSIYTRPDLASSWAPVGHLPHIPIAFDAFGEQVALDADGGVALATGGDGTNGEFVVTAFRYGVGGYAAEPLFVGDGQSSGWGAPSIALSADGNTALVAQYDNTVHLLRYVPGSGWTPRTIVSATFGGQRRAAMSADASTIAWTTSAGVSVVTGGPDGYGTTVALPMPTDVGLFMMSNVAVSRDGSTIVGVADPGTSPRRALVWARASNGYFLQGTLWSDNDADLSFGMSIAMSASGDRVALADGDYSLTNSSIHGEGMVFVYERTAGAWGDAALVASPNQHMNELFGVAIAMTADGAHMLIGAPDDVYASPSGGAYSWSTDEPAGDGSPDARDDSVTTTMNTPVQIDATANDQMADGATITYPATTTAGGTLTTTPGSNTATYTPPSPQFLGSDSFTYTDCDDDAVPVCDSATVTITVNPIVPFDNGPLFGSVTADARPVVGNFRTTAAGHTRGHDILWYRPGAAAETMWQAGTNGFTTAPAPVIGGAYTPVAGDFDGNGRTDVLWYAPGAGQEVLSQDVGGLFKNVTAPQVNGTYRPLVGNFDCDAHNNDDILWYAAGPTREALWTGTTNGFAGKAAPSVNGTYTPIVGRFDNSNCDDILWYAPTTGATSLWRGTTHGFVGAPVAGPSKASTPVIGDFNGDHYTDIVWYAPGATPARVWLGGPGGFTTASGPSIGTSGYRPVVGDFNGDGRDDIFWYASDSTPETLWRATGTGFVTVAVPEVHGWNPPLVVDANRDGRDDLVWYAATQPQARLWYGRVQ